jgi:hypothetical protein
VSVSDPFHFCKKKIDCVIHITSNVIGSLWNAQLSGSSGGYVISAPSWALVIPSGGTASFGFTASGTFVSPTQYTYSDTNGAIVCVIGDVIVTTTTAIPPTMITTTTVSLSTPPAGTPLSSLAVGASLPRFAEWLARITTMEGPENNRYRVVHSSGGAAGSGGNVVSEGQAYGLAMASSIMSSMSPSSTDYSW